MQVVPPDFGRRIDLPGAGPCPRPVDIDQDVTGFIDLVSLRVYSFAADMAIHGEAEGDELFVVLLRGAIALAVEQNGEQVGAFTLDADGGTGAIYMPPHSEYHLTAKSDADVAYARVRGGSASTRSVAGFSSVAGRVAGAAAAMTFVRLTLATGAELPLAEGKDAERLLHLRSAEGGGAELDGRPLGNWQTAALGRGEGDCLAVGQGPVDVLLVSAGHA